MTPYESMIFAQLCQLYRNSHSPVRTLILADLLGKHDRYIRTYLVRLEKKEYIRRVGQRGGWLPTRRPAHMTSSLAA
ncbi:MAG: hypothetical protein JNJ61_04385 [Anaerolineae bacterium]|nr:hypothetical protein [Anaerolineae bacterium]